jgi:phage terminase small subunit
MAKALTLKQRKFADLFIELGNQTEAAIRAGYKKSNARSTASELMDKPHVKEYIAARMAEKDNETIASQDEILMFLTSVMRGEVKEQIPLLDGDGYQKLAELDETAPKDRIKAAELLGKRYAMWTDNKNIGGQVEVVIVDDIDDEDFDDES